MTLAPDAEIDERSAAEPEASAVMADDVWYHEDEHGWVRQYQTWAGDGVLLINEENDLDPSAWHYALNEGYGLGISSQGAYRRRVRGNDQVVDSNTGFLRFSGDEVGVEHFVGGPGSVTFLGIDPAICPGFFDEIATVPTFTVTSEMTLTHLRLVRAQASGADDITLETLALNLLKAAVEQHHAGISSYSRRTTGRVAATSRRRSVRAAAPPGTQTRPRPDRPHDRMLAVPPLAGVSRDHGDDHSAVPQAAAHPRRVAAAQQRRA